MRDRAQAFAFTLLILEFLQTMWNSEAESSPAILQLQMDEEPLTVMVMVLTLLQPLLAQHLELRSKL
jgi:hypothetical protein